jgi:uncharacterized membrane protein YgcG
VNRNRIGAAAGAAFLVIFLLFGGAGAAQASSATPRESAEVSELEFASFDAEYFLSRDPSGLSHVRVVETITARFPEKNVNKGFYRDIPKYYKERPLHPTIVSVTTPSGNAVPYSTEDYETGSGLDYKFFSIAVGDDSYVHGELTYVIEYTLDNVIAYFEDANLDEFYWDVNGVDTGVAIGEVSATVHIAPELVGALTGNTACYPGAYSSLDGCVLTQSSDGTVFSVSVPEMSSYDTLTIDIGFAPKTFVMGERIQDNFFYRDLPRLAFALALLGLIAAIIVRFGLWRDAKGRGIIVPQYTAPDDHDLILAADLIGKGHEALSASFVSLAVRGFVNIVDKHPDGKGAADTRFALEYRSKEGATAQELRVLKALFDGLDDVGETVTLGSIDETAGAELYALGLRARDRSVAAGLRAQPRGVLATWIRRSRWLVLAALAAALVWSFVVGVDDGPLFGWLFGCVIVFIITGRFLKKPYLLTSKGAEARDYLLGIKDYLQLAEKDRLRVLQSPEGAQRVTTADSGAIVKLNEKLLPYAVLWDIENEWAKVLEVEYTASAQSPTWISTDLSRVDFGRSLRSFADSSTSRVRPIVPVYTSSSSGGSSWSGGSSSSFSGSSGGGFSGGGGGGGGMRGR